MTKFEEAVLVASIRFDPKEIVLAVLRAIREPSAVMMDAAERFDDLDARTCASAETHWTAAIDALIAEGQRRAGE